MKYSRIMIMTLSLVLMFGMTAVTGFAQEGARAKKFQGKPSYPELAKKMNVSGTVKVEVVVLPSGAVKSAKALGGHPLLIDAAVNAAKQTKYEAAAAETTEVIPFNFSLSGN